MKRIFSILLVFLFAGCTAPAPEDQTSLVDEDDFSLDSGKGAIRGVVVDDRFRPVPGALVLLQPGGLTTIASEDGEFNFLNLAPAPYTLRVSAEGHEAAPQRITVVAGEFAEAALEARRLVIQSGSTVTFEYSIFTSCGYNAVVVGAPLDCTLDQSGDTSRESFVTDYSEYPDVTYLVTEMKASKIGDYEVRMRPTDHDQGPDGNFAIQEIKDAQYMKIVHKVGEINEVDNLLGGNVAWNQTEPILHILYVDSLGKDNASGTFGVGVYLGIEAKFIQTAFLGEPEVDVDSYCVLCD